MARTGYLIFLKRFSKGPNSVKWECVWHYHVKKGGKRVTKKDFSSFRSNYVNWKYELYQLTY